MTEQHIIRNVKNELEETMSSWDITDKMFAVVTDNESNRHCSYSSGSHGLSPYTLLCPHTKLGCGGQSKGTLLVLVPEEENQSNSQLFSHECQGKCGFVQCSKRQGIDMPLNEVETRWNSIFFMMEP